MQEIERRRQDERTRRGGESVAGSGPPATVDYYGALDNLINETLSGDSEAFIEQSEQTHGQ